MISSPNTILENSATGEGLVFKEAMLILIFTLSLFGPSLTVNTILISLKDGISIQVSIDPSSNTLKNPNGIITPEILKNIKSNLE